MLRNDLQFRHTKASIYKYMTPRKYFYYVFIGRDRH